MLPENCILPREERPWPAVTFPVTAAHLCSAGEAAPDLPSDCEGTGAFSVCDRRALQGGEEAAGSRQRPG